jgi:hypothetical protein
MEWTNGVTVADWNNDGKLDLIVGLSHQPDQAGLVVLTNISQGNSIQFSTPVAIMAGDKPLDVPEMSTAPTAADWDSDGLFDLLIGAGDGSVRLYRNQGTKSVPDFSIFEELISANKLGTNSKVCIADWDLDGKLDLIVGDHGEPFEKVLSPEEEALKREARKSHEHAMARWGNVFRSYLQLRRSRADPTIFEKTLHQLQKENQKQKLAYSKYEEYVSGRQYHGNAWVFLRQ